MAGMDDVSGSGGCETTGDAAAQQLFASSRDYLTYIKPVALDEVLTGYAVYTEDGVELAVFGSYDAAYFSARQYNLTPVSVH